MLVVRAVFLVLCVALCGLNGVLARRNGGSWWSLVGMTVAAFASGFVARTILDMMSQ